MGLLTGSIAVTRFAARKTAAPDFEAAAFREILPGSEVREANGFVPFELDAPYEVGHEFFAFRVRMDRLRPDPTAVKERIRQLIKTELELTGAPFVGPKKRKELRFLAEQELIVRSAPRSSIVECALDGGVLYIGSTAKNAVGMVRVLLAKAGVDTAPNTPWFKLGLPEVMSELVEVKDQAESVYGCQFLKALIAEGEFLPEPEAGRIRIALRGAKASLTGEVMADLHRYLERADSGEQECEILSAKMLAGELAFNLEATGFRLSGIKLPAPKTGHWTNDLLARIEAIAGLYESLERKFERLIKAAT